MLDRRGLYVLELSSYQLELCPSSRFKVAVLLNITPDHLDRHGDMDGYILAKRNIFHNQGAGDVAIVSIDAENTAKIFDELDRKKGRKVIPIATTCKAPGGVYIEDNNLIDDLNDEAKVVMSLDGLANLPGLHNAQNIIAAYVAARTVRVTVDDIVLAIQSFPGLAHRQEVVENFDGITFVNDSKATNGEATQKALACYDNIYWIVGGRAKETGILGLDDFYPRIRKAFLIGECANDFAAILDGKVDLDICGDLWTATSAARTAALQDGGPNAVVLLSPACASFDQFANFEERGDTFKTYVDALRHEHVGLGEGSMT